MRCHCVAKFGEELQTQVREPLEPFGREIILEVVASGVCHSDLHLHEGGFDLGDGEWLSYADRGLDLPIVPGHETVGRVIATGPDSPDLSRDKKYVVYPWIGCGDCSRCTAGDEHLCSKPRFLGFYQDGGYSTQIRVPSEKYLFDIGDLDPGFAAPLACSGLTAFSALKKVADLVKTSPPLIIGAGGLGLMATQILKAWDAAAPVVVDLDATKRDAAQAAGARGAVDPREKDALQQIETLCGGAPTVVLDFVGSEITARLGFDSVVRGGTLIIVGLYGGRSQWPLPMLVSKSVRIFGSYTGSLNEFSELMELVHQGALSPIPTQDFPLDQANEAMSLLKNGRVVGRAILLG